MKKIKVLALGLVLGVAGIAYAAKSNVQSASIEKGDACCSMAGCCANGACQMGGACCAAHKQ